MSSHDLVSTSKFLSLLLRHAPETIGLKLDSSGWASIDELREKCQDRGHDFSLEGLHKIIASSAKTRFEISSDQLKIRAFQGHSIDIDLLMQPLSPPSLLYHGTAKRFIGSILAGGLLPMQRQHVHLSEDFETARGVGLRHAKTETELVVLTLDTKGMEQDGYSFYQAGNGVWLTKDVPVKYISGL